jgi:hypothetical protein
MNGTRQDNIVKPDRNAVVLVVILVAVAVAVAVFLTSLRGL